MNDIMVLLLQLLVWVAFGSACALLAKQRGRNPIGWFFIGMISPCIGMILVLVLPDLKKHQAEVDRLKMQNRMLKERLDLERMTADQRHAETAGRLRAHDRVLGLDTAPADEAMVEIGPGAGPLVPVAIDPDMLANRLWYYAVDESQNGPVSLADLRPLWSDGRLKPEHLVWAQGMDQWQKIADVPGLSEALHG